MTSSRAYVIAEAGACGDGDFDKMLEQIKVAARARVDAVKFQWTSDANEMACRRRAVADGYAGVYRKYLQWDASWHEKFSDACEQHGVDYLCTVYLADDLKTVSPFVRHFKVSSFESTDAAFLTACVEVVGDRRMLVSTGLCSDADVAFIRSTCLMPVTFGQVYLSDESQLVLMQCTSAYPTSLADMNLGVIQHEALTGYSDHTDPQLVFTGAFAVLAGARYVEAHMRLDETETTNPDAAHAMTGEQLEQYVASIRMAERALGSDEKVVLPCEQPMLRYKVQKPQ